MAFSLSGLSFPDLYQRCREAFLVNSDLTLRTQLTEFRDHKLIRTKKGVDGMEYLVIPLDSATLIEFKEQQENDTEWTWLMLVQILEIFPTAKDPSEAFYLCIFSECLKLRSLLGVKIVWYWWKAYKCFIAFPRTIFWFNVSWCLSKIFGHMQKKCLLQQQYAQKGELRLFQIVTALMIKHSNPLDTQINK